MVSTLGFKYEPETKAGMDELEARIGALERALTDQECDFSELATEAETQTRLADTETQVEELTDRVAELEAATQALRGYIGNVRAVNRDVEKRADLALSKVESLTETQATNRDHQCHSPVKEQKRHTATETPSHKQSNQHAQATTSTAQQRSVSSSTGATAQQTPPPAKPTEQKHTAHSTSSPGQHSGSSPEKHSTQHSVSHSESSAPTTPTEACKNCQTGGHTPKSATNGSRPLTDETARQGSRGQPEPTDDQPQPESTDEFQADGLFKPSDNTTEEGTFERIRKLF